MQSVGDITCHMPPLQPIDPEPPPGVSSVRVCWKINSQSCGVSGGHVTVKQGERHAVQGPACSARAEEPWEGAWLGIRCLSQKPGVNGVEDISGGNFKVPHMLIEKFTLLGGIFF